MTTYLPMGRPDRRQVLMGGAAALATSAIPLRLAAQGTPEIVWWDVYGTLTPLHQAIWDKFAADGQGTVTYTHSNPANMLQSLQLAFRSGELPDVFNLGGNPATIASLFEAGWFTPLDGLAFDKPFQQATLIEGATVFDGKQYGLPIFSNLWHNANLWYHSDPMAAAGGDPEAGIASWDDMRAIAKAGTTGGRYGLMLPLQFTTRMADLLNDMAAAAGAPGQTDPATGDYTYASEPYLETLEFLLSFQKDGSLHPASSSVDARQGRSRWIAGESLMFFDGPWNSGVLLRTAPEALETTNVSNVPTPGGEAPIIGRGAQLGDFYLSGQTENAELVVALLQQLTTPEYYRGLAEGMDQPPLDLAAVKDANVHPTYAKVVESYTTTMKRLPDPLAANPQIAQVYSHMREVTPGLGEIIQGAFAGAFDDPAPILQDYADQMARARDAAIKAAQAEGVEASVDDWVFADWKRGEDYAR
jgi:multiple sugar transport system substrate-binding protein